MKKDTHFGIVILFSIIVSIEITLTFLFGIGLVHFFGSKLGFWGTIFLRALGVFLGISCSLIVNRIFLKPIKKLNMAMDQVAKGNFDITLETNVRSKEIKNMYEKFNVMTRELKATEILKTDFVSNVSHEIKTPINAIEGYATLLQASENLTETERIYVEKIFVNSERLSTLVGNVLLLSKIENQAIEISPAGFRVDEQIRHVVMMLEPRWEEKKIEFDIELDDVTINGNEGLTFHVWYNLLSNAIKFSLIGGLVKMRLYKTENDVVFTIEDRGNGISDKEIKHIFDKFYQGDTSHKQEGNGLGLALVKKILNNINGKICVENLEKGCRFTVTLPDDHE